MGGRVDGNSSGGKDSSFFRSASNGRATTPTTLRIYETTPDIATGCKEGDENKAYGLYFVYGSLYGLCNYVPAVKNPTPNQAELVARIQEFYSSTPLPIPNPEISAKNGGICGVVHTLDLHIPATRTYTYPNTDFGGVMIIVHGIPTVDWGDGKKVTYKNTGAPYPNSDIGHSWTTAGKYNINVTTRWSAEWTVLTPEGETYGGILSNLTTTGSIPNFNVLQAQAVLVR